MPISFKIRRGSLPGYKILGRYRSWKGIAMGVENSVCPVNPYWHVCYGSGLCTKLKKKKKS